MTLKQISLPEIYLESADFRFFCDWFEKSLAKTQYDTENFIDLYDPLRVPEQLIWLLGDTMGFRYDDRLPSAFNRLVLMYFMSMIRNRGSKDGVTLAAETNLAQLGILDKAIDNEILYNRLEDTSIPVNSVYVTTNTKYAYIDVVYFSTRLPVDACIEYVRPVGMFLFQHAGVRFDARTKVSVDARLTDMRDIGMTVGPTQVGHYRREDYARLQKTISGTVDTAHTRQPVWYRNSDSESGTSADMNPGYRSLCSLQLCNNEEIVRSLVDPIFSLGFQPQSVDVVIPDGYLNPQYVDEDVPKWNLRYNLPLDEQITHSEQEGYHDIEVIDSDRTIDVMNPRPAVNPAMATIGDAISLNSDNTAYTYSEDGQIHVADYSFATLSFDDGPLTVDESFLYDANEESTESENNPIE